MIGATDGATDADILTPVATTPAAAATIRTVDALADGRWDAYVRSHPDAHAYHLAGWMSVLRACYGFRPAALAAEDGGRICGVLPLMGRRRPVSGNRLRSLPAVHTAGPLADTPELAASLVEAAFDVGVRYGLDVNVDTRVSGLDAINPRLRIESRTPSWILEIPRDRDAWLKARSQNLRRSIKRAAKAEITVRETDDEATLRAWYELYLITMRRHRSIPRPLKQLVVARRALPPGVFRFFVAEREGRPVAGGIWHVFNGTVELLYNASDETAWSHRPNHALYDHVLRWAADEGLHRLDFGFAPPGSPLGEFKAAWGATLVPEQRYVDASRSAATMDAGARLGNVSEQPSGRAQELFHRAWGSAPLAATRAAGLVAYRFL